MKRDRTAVLAKPGTYVLVFECAEATQVSVGALGEVGLAGGYLFYVGSAFGPGGLVARLRHHLRPIERPRWHVDYVRRVASLSGAWCASGPRCLEHDWASTLSSIRGFTLPRAGFGSSDCGCDAHLFHARRLPARRGMRERLVPADPGSRVDYFERAELVRAAGVARVEGSKSPRRRICG